MSRKSSAEVREDVKAARDRLAGTVGELGTAVDETREDVKRKARKAAPVAAAAAGALLLLKLLRR